MLRSATLPVLALRIAGVTLSLALALMPPLCGAIDIGPPPDPSVIIVCEHGSVKSLIAASLFNKEAQARGLPFRAAARGISPDAAVPKKVVDALRAEGIDVASYQPRALAKTDLAPALKVITIGQEVRVDRIERAATEQWNDVPPATIDYAAARLSLMTHIKTLLDELSTRK
jgi:arsenate reductase